MMSSFFDKKINLTLAEADAIAASGQDLGSRAFGYECNPKEISGSAAAEYGVVTIAAMGCGNRGTSYLVGKTPRAKALVKQGKVRRLVEQGVAPKIAAVAVKCQYGMEVAGIAMWLINLPDGTLARLAGLPRSKWEALGIDTTGVSMPRLWAAAEIAMVAKGA
jgi:hypothetical protein